MQFKLQLATKLKQWTYLGQLGLLTTLQRVRYMFVQSHPPKQARVVRNTSRKLHLSRIRACMPATIFACKPIQWVRYNSMHRHSKGNDRHKGPLSSQPGRLICTKGLSLLAHGSMGSYSNRNWLYRGFTESRLSAAVGSLTISSRAKLPLQSFLCERLGDANGDPTNVWKLEFSKIHQEMSKKQGLVQYAMGWTEVAAPIAPELMC